MQPRRTGRHGGVRALTRADDEDAQGRATSTVLLRTLRWPVSCRGGGTRQGLLPLQHVCRVSGRCLSHQSTGQGRAGLALPSFPQHAKRCTSRTSSITANVYTSNKYVSMCLYIYGPLVILHKGACRVDGAMPSFPSEACQHPHGPTAVESQIHATKKKTRLSLTESTSLLQALTSPPAPHPFLRFSSSSSGRPTGSRMSCPSLTPSPPPPSACSSRNLA